MAIESFSSVTGMPIGRECSNNHFETDGLPFRCAPGQAAAQVERYVAREMKFKYKLPPELVGKCSTFEEFACGGLQATVRLKNSQVYREVLISNSMYLVAIRGYADLPFAVSEIVDVFQTEEDKSPAQRGGWQFWDDWQKAT
jgi:hypothetical protein